MPLSQSQVHYLATVMRRAGGDDIWLFNGKDGEWRATLAEMRKKTGFAVPQAQTRTQTTGPDLWLLFAPVKRARTELIVEKATEMGVSVIQPVTTQWTNSDRLRPDRLSTIAIEAAEQSERVTVPEVRKSVPLANLLKTWTHDRVLIFADERAEASSPHAPTLPAAVLIGPEGGFSPEEREALLEMIQCHPISLGPRILRADTATVAALAYVQSRFGDWS